MFADGTTVTRKVVNVETVRRLVAAGVTPAINPSHKATIDAMTSRYGIEISIPEVAPKVALNTGDQMIVMSVRGLPRLEGRHEYTDEEIEAATFEFSVWEVLFPAETGSDAATVVEAMRASINWFGHGVDFTLSQKELDAMMRLQRGETKIVPSDSYVVSGDYLREASTAQARAASGAGMDVGDYRLDEYAKAVLSGDNASQDALSSGFGTKKWQQELVEAESNAKYYNDFAKYWLPEEAGIAYEKLANAYTKHAEFLRGLIAIKY
jgi:hypothetical protein